MPRACYGATKVASFMKQFCSMSIGRRFERCIKAEMEDATSGLLVSLASVVVFARNLGVGAFDDFCLFDDEFHRLVEQNVALH